MKQVFFHTRSIIPFLGSGIVALTLFSGILYKQSQSMERENRKLIIQNDSIMSVNIELKNSLIRKSSFTENKVAEKNTKAERRS